MGLNSTVEPTGISGWNLKPGNTSQENWDGFEAREMQPHQL
jgi:hypothetical protein